MKKEYKVVYKVSYYVLAEDEDKALEKADNLFDRDYENDNMAFEEGEVFLNE